MDNWEAVFSTRSMRQLRGATTKELLGEAIFVRSVPRCYKQDKSRSLVVRQSPASKGVNTEVKRSTAVGSRYQTTIGEDTANWEHLVRAVVKCWVCELTIALWSLVVTICKCSINPINNPNPVYSQSYTQQYITHILYGISDKLIMLNIWSFHCIIVITHILFYPVV
jgi:hypothetical protein